MNYRPLKKKEMLSESFLLCSTSELYEFEKEADVDDVICLDRSFQLGDYVLVKFLMKKTSPLCKKDRGNRKQRFHNKFHETNKI